MQLKEAGITILFNEDGLKIELHDEEAGVLFAHVALNAAQTCQAMSRLSQTRCNVEVRNLEKVGKREEYKPFIFPIPDDVGYGKERDRAATQAALELCPEGWTPDTYFGSQDSFLIQDGKPMARCMIRRWVDVDEGGD